MDTIGNLVLAATMTFDIHGTIHNRLRQYK